MFRETSRTTTKSNMELSTTKIKWRVSPFVTESPTTDSTEVLDTLRCFLKER